MTDTLLTCPSSQPDQEGASIIGVVTGRAGAGSARMLRKKQPLAPLIDLVPDDIRPTEVFRFASPCAGAACRHFADNACSLAARIVAGLPAVSERLAPCAIRPSCRWWRQEGPSACHRCPQVVTEPYTAADFIRDVAAPPERGVPDHGQR